MQKTISNLLSAYLANSPKSCIELLRHCHSIGDSLNDAGHRFYKAKLIDKKYSRVFPYLKYVDAIGYDWVFCGYKISGKSQQKMFRNRTDKTSEITIANKQGKEYKKIRLFDYMILTQTTEPYSIAIANYDSIHQYFQYNQDKIVARIPYSDLDFIIHPLEKISFANEAIFDYGRFMDRLLDEMLDSGILTKQNRIMPTCSKIST